MTTQDAGTPTPPTVEKFATKEAKLERTALIGLFGTASAPKALIRLPRGETRTVTVGDRIGSGTVGAIGEDRLVLLLRGNRQEVMQMPRG
tara:strand:+ start:40997 stop:41266 length:270 start_codon:yes stop_codon:yes gene_type:complete